MKRCSCGRPGCRRLASQDGHAWDPLAEPVDDCVLCCSALDLMPHVRVDIVSGHPPLHGPPLRPVAAGVGYAHPECVRPVR